MQFIKAILGLMPNWVITLTRPIVKALGIKHIYEHFYWKMGFKKYGEVLENDRYEPIMLAMAEEENDDFLSGKIVADFGCGPRGHNAFKLNVIYSIHSGDGIHSFLRKQSGFLGTIVL